MFPKKISQVKKNLFKSTPHWLSKEWTYNTLHLYVPTVLTYPVRTVHIHTQRVNITFQNYAILVSYNTSAPSFQGNAGYWIYYLLADLIERLLDDFWEGSKKIYLVRFYRFCAV
jgi:hypothetical protein